MMHRSIAATLALLLCAAGAAAAEDGFVSLFNGRNLDGWKVGANADSFKVEDGMIVLNGPTAHLFYEGPVENHNFKNFHFKADVKTTPGSNSGIYFHTRFQESGWPKAGYEIQVNISHGDPKKTGGLYGIRDVANPPAKDNEWYTQEIIVRGKRIISKVNGKTVVDYTEPEGVTADRRISSGTFALQAHDPKSKVYFKNIEVKPLTD
jgi:hypothetical protein